MDNLLNIIVAILLLAGLFIFTVFSVIANNIDEIIEWLNKNSKR